MQYNTVHLSGTVLCQGLSSALTCAISVDPHNLEKERFLLFCLDECCLFGDVLGTCLSRPWLKVRRNTINTLTLALSPPGTLEATWLEEFVNYSSWKWQLSCVRGIRFSSPADQGLDHFSIDVLYSRCLSCVLFDILLQFM